MYTLVIQPLTQIIETVFVIFNSIFRNTGIAVLGVSIAVSFLCLPLYIVAERWQEVQRQKEKSMEHWTKAIKKTFKGDEQYLILNAYYRENHYQPLMALRSSFGLLIQIPFFIAAYSFLSTLPALQEKSFLFIRDMGNPDSMFSIGSFTVNILPILMTAINMISGAIYTKGLKLRDKVQTFGMALIFLVILYDSPAGLVLYWTMNNIFSMVKNIFYKLRSPLKILYLLLILAVAVIDGYIMFRHRGLVSRRIVATLLFSCLLFAPLLVKLANRLLDSLLQPLVNDSKTRLCIFLFSACSLAVLTGFVLPSLVIGSSVTEFSNLDTFASPMTFIWEALIKTTGLFVFWPLCVYLLFRKRIQTLISVFMLGTLLVVLLDTFVCVRDYGTISRVIRFSSVDMDSTILETFLNLTGIVVLVALPLVFLKYRKTAPLLFTALVALLVTTAIIPIKTFQIQNEYKQYCAEIGDKVDQNTEIEPVFHLSKTGKNVIVFMLDRAENAYIQPIFDSFPELYDQFSGFTLYKNVVSFNRGTLLGAPGLYGGYEYTPAEMNKRSTEKLVDKHNESLLLMPRVFTEQAGFTATVTDLSWANYKWIPDMSICDSYPAIHGTNIQRKYTQLYLDQHESEIPANITTTQLRRNLVWYSLFRAVPTFLRDSVYDDGSWWSPDETSDDMMEFIDYYSELVYLKDLTDFTGTQDTYCTIVNETTHSGLDLKPPAYEPAQNTSGARPEMIISLRSIDCNIAALKKLGEWFDYLKENGCYDNTRIILVSDHGIGSAAGHNLDFELKDWDWPLPLLADHFHPLLMVKDFKAEGKLETDWQFMTNADVPAIAFQGIIEHPVNPFTGKEISELLPEQKKASGVVLMDNYQPGMNGTYTFSIPDELWYTVTGSIFDINNWVQGIR